HSTPFPQDWRITNAKTYRACFLRALAIAEENEYRKSSKALRRILGRSRNGVRGIIAAAGMKNIAQYATCELDVSLPIEKQVRERAKEVQGRPQLFLIENATVEELPYEDEEAKSQVAEYLAQGKRVQVKFQQASWQKIVSNTPFAAKRASKP